MTNKKNFRTIRKYNTILLFAIDKYKKTLPINPLRAILYLKVAQLCAEKCIAILEIKYKPIPGMSVIHS